MSMRQTWIVFRKELVDGLRDRAAVTTTLLQAVSSPIVYGVIVMVVAGRDVEPLLTLPVAGGEHAPALVAWLERQNEVDVTAAPPDPRAAVRAGDVDVVLSIPADFGELAARGLTAPVELVHGDGGASRRAAERARGLVGAYGAEVAALRLTARGVAPAVMTPVSVEAVDVSPPPQSHGGFLMFVPILLLWLALSAGGAMALDSTVGERERSSLEPLLLNAVARPAVVIGKWLASSVFACGSVIAAVLATLIVLHWLPWHEYGVQMRVRDADIVLAGLVMLPLGMLMGAALMLVSAVARSLQQGHTYLAVLAMTTVLCAMATFVFELADVAWIAPIPISGQLALVADLLAGASPEPLRYALSALGSALAAVLLIVVTTHLLKREAILFRG